MMGLRLVPVQRPLQKPRLNKGFDLRLVRFEHAHNIQRSQFDAFCGGIELRDGSQILDLGAGYGAATRELLTRHAGRDVQCVLIDPSIVQLEIARREITEALGEDFNERHVSYVRAAFPKRTFKPASFDHVLAKMVIHEMPKRAQRKAFAAMREVLRPDGTLTMWDVALEDATAAFVRSVIRSKDKHCGYTDLVRDRYLMTRKEFVALFRDAGFKKPEHQEDIAYLFDARKRFGAEFKSTEAFQAWLTHIRRQSARVSPAIKTKIHYQDAGDTITFLIPKMIMRARR